MKTNTSRRKFLARSLGLGCSLAASPLITPVTLASAPWDHRLVVIILRGGMDGLDAVRPLGDPLYQTYRDPLLKEYGAAPVLDLDGYFALHPAMHPLMPLWKAGELGFAHAVSTPYRDRRSHFDGQDVLEAGTGGPGPEQTRDGWLNRLLQVTPGVESKTAYAVGRGSTLVTSGPAEVADWSPGTRLVLSAHAERLMETLVHDDPLFRDAVAEALDLSEQEFDLDPEEGEEVDGAEMAAAMAAMNKTAGASGGTEEIARFAAQRLREETRIASYSINGFDTHAVQFRHMPKMLEKLSANILTLRDTLGDVWGKTTVIAMTEFGRTARANGTGGTDHGTGGVMVMAGGALRGGRVVTDWPGLEEADLYQRRDLLPTRDLRAHAGWIMRGMFGVNNNVIENTIFPGLDLGSDPGHLL